MSAIERYSINHPVIADNDFVLWKKYGISGWPGFVLLDGEGNLIMKTGGEGNRELLKRSIQNAIETGKKNGTLSNKKKIIELKQRSTGTLRFPAKLDYSKETGLFAVSDAGHNRVIVFTLDSNKASVKHIIGSGRAGFSDGSFEASEFSNPHGIVFRDNKLYIADTDNHSIRVADLDKKSVKTISGNGKQGYIRSYSGDPLKVSLSSPWDLAFDGDDLYIAMAGIHQVWKYSSVKNSISSFAGSGYENIKDGSLQDAALAQPSGLSISNGFIYFADSEVSGIRSIDIQKKTVSTIAGKGLFVFGNKDGSLKTALLQHPLGLDVSGDSIYIADTYNHSIRIIDIAKNSIGTLIGYNSLGTCNINEKSCNYLQLYEPEDVIYVKGKLYIADTNNHLIREYDFSKASLTDILFLSD